MTTRIISSILQIIAVPVWALLALIAFFMENYWIGVTATISSILIIIISFCNAHSGFIETKNVHKLKCIYLDYWTS